MPRLRPFSGIEFPCGVGFGSCHSFGVAVGLSGYGMCQMSGQFEGQLFLKMRRVGRLISHLSNVVLLKVQVVEKQFTCPRGESLLIERHLLVEQIVRGPITANVCVCAVVAFRSRHCPRGQTLNEDNTYRLHFNALLQKHFVWAFINREKSGIRKPVQFGLLGYKFVPTYAKGDKGKYQLVVSEKGWGTLKQKLKFVTKKTTASTFDERMAKLKEIQRGWLNHFRMGSIQGKLKEIDSWVRNRLRYCIWHDWKKLDRKRKNLIRLGISKGQAYAWSRTRMGGWAVAQSPILVTTVTLKRLMQRGYESMLSYYEKASPQFNEPLYTRPVRTVV